MNHDSRRLLLVLAAALATACVQAAPPPAATEADARAGIAAAHHAWSRALVASDVDSLMQLYTEDAVVLPPGLELAGREAIRGWYSSDTTWHTLSHTMDADELTVYDSVAVERGRWSSTWRVGGGPEQSASDRYVIFWKRGGDGRWRIHYDIWHSPPAVASSPQP